MRYILNDSGYIQTISFNYQVECNNKSCIEYTGQVPTGYESLVEWSELANINAYKVIDGNLTFDSTEDARLQELWASQQSQSLERITLNMVYPVGSIYISVNSTNPGTLFGGTWEQLKDRFLLGAGDTYENGATGGEAKHTLTANEIPDLPVKFSNNNAEVLTKDGTVNTNLVSGYSRGAGKWDSGTDGTLYADGGNQSHNNMPPYLVVYIWKRIS